MSEGLLTSPEPGAEQIATLRARLDAGSLGVGPSRKEQLASASLTEEQWQQLVALNTSSAREREACLAAAVSATVPEERTFKQSEGWEVWINTHWKQGIKQRACICRCCAYSYLS